MFAIVAVVATMLVASAAVATEDAFAGKKKKYSQAISQANACGNGKLPLDVYCQNIDSQVQGKKNSVAQSGSQGQAQGDDGGYDGDKGGYGGGKGSGGKGSGGEGGYGGGKGGGSH